MRANSGFIQIPVIIIILIIIGSVAIFFQTHSKLIDQKSSDAQKDATESGSITTDPKNSQPSPLPSYQAKVQITPTKTPSPVTLVGNTPSPAAQPSNLPTPKPAPVTSSVSIGLSSAPDSPTPQASGQVSITLVDVIPYYTTGRLADFGPISGSVSGLKPNTEYSVSFAPPSRGGGVVVSQFKTSELGNATFSTGGSGLTYTPVSPTWTVEIYYGGDLSNLSLTGNFSINPDNTISK